MDRADQAEDPARDPDDIAADLADFVADYLDDEANGACHALSHYLRRYPNAQDEVAVEYLRLRGIRSSDDAHVPDATDADPRVGHYLLQERLGSGGQGEVWVAVDENLQRKVALKLLTSAFVTEERRARFRREAEAIARLEHPGLAAVHDADIDGDPPYIAMRLVAGVDLGTSFEHARRVRGDAASKIAPVVPWIPTTRAELHSVLRFFERAARALHAAHDAGVLHRDVKPGNVMVTAAGDPVLLDFGLAGGDDLSADGELTREGDVFGTLAYMAPEQLRGQTTDLDARADVWSLGVTMYEALVGERPFQGRGPTELALAIDAGPVPDPVLVNPVVTGDARVVLHTALERSRDRRYRTALDLAEDLRRVAEFEPIRARPAGPVLRLRRWCRREPAWAAALGVTLVALIGGLVAALTVIDRQRRLLDQLTAQHWVAEVSKLTDRAPAGGLALGLEIVDLDDTTRNRSSLYGPLLETTLARQFALPESRVWDIAFVDGSKIAFGGAEGELRLVDLHSRGAPAKAKVDGDVRSLAVDPSGQSVFVGTATGRLVRVAVEGFRPLDELELGEGPVVDLAWVGDALLALQAPNHLHVISPAEPLRAERIALGEGAFAAFEPYGDGEHVIVSPRAFRGLRQVSTQVVVAAVDERRVIARLPHGQRVRDFAWAPAATRLATIDRGGTMRLFDLSDPGSPEPVRAPVDHGLPGGAIEISTDGRLVFAGLDGQGADPHQPTVLAYSLDDPRPEPVWTIRGTGRVVDLALAAGGTRLAAASWDSRVRVIDSSSGRELFRHVERDRPNDLYWSSGDQHVLSIGTAESVFVWRDRKSALCYRIDAAEAGMGELLHAEFTSDGERALVVDRGGRAALFDTPTAEEGGVYAPDNRSPGAKLVDFGAPGGSAQPGALARAARDAAVVHWVGPGGDYVMLDAASLDVVRRGAVDGFARGPLRALAVSASGDAWVAVDADGAAWAEAEGSVRRVALPADVRLHRAILGPDGAALYVASDDGRVWGGRRDGALRELPRLRRSGPNDVTSISDLQVSPSGRTLVATVGRDRLAFWDTHSRELTAREVPPLRRERIAWLDDRRLLSIGSGPNSVQVLGPESVVLPDAWHDERLAGCATSDGGRIAVTSAQDGEVLVWDAHTGGILARCAVHTLAPIALDVDRDVRVLSCTSEGAVVWPVDSLEAARRLAPRGLAEKERKSLPGRR